VKIRLIDLKKAKIIARQNSITLDIALKVLYKRVEDKREKKEEKHG
jgi:hypothetical protein